jgi:hypothetical protein
MIKYLRLDAEYGGSGLQDTEGLDVDIMTLPLSDATVYKLKAWLNQYWYALTNTKSLLNDYISLDKEGLALKQDIHKDLQAHDLDYLVLYWSEGRGCFLNDNGERIRDTNGLLTEVTKQ